MSYSFSFTVLVSKHEHENVNAYKYVHVNEYENENENASECANEHGRHKPTAIDHRTIMEENQRPGVKAWF